MYKYKSRWRDRDLRDLDGTNKLYDVVKYFGGYLWYIENINEGAYDAFFWKNHDKMKYIFINKANAEAKKYFGKKQYSGRKMRQMLITSKGNSVISYEWISNYVEYILNNCFNNQEIKERVINIIQEDCDYCVNRRKSDEWKVFCTKNLLGFQYNLLNEISGRGVRASKSASENISIIENSHLISEVIDNCKITIERK